MDPCTFEQKSRNFLLQMGKARLSFNGSKFQNDKEFLKLHEKSLYEKNLSKDIIKLAIETASRCKTKEQFMRVFDFFIECHSILFTHSISLAINYDKHCEGSFDIEFFSSSKKMGHISTTIGFLEKPTLFFATYQGNKNISPNEFKCINWPKKFSLFARDFHEINFFLLNPAEHYEAKVHNSKLPFFIYNSFYDSANEKFFCGFTYEYRFIEHDPDADFSYHFAPIKRKKSTTQGF